MIRTDEAQSSISSAPPNPAATYLHTPCERCTAWMHTGRIFQSDSTLQDTEIVQICTISMSRLGANYLMQGGSTIRLKWTLQDRCAGCSCCTCLATHRHVRSCALVSQCTHTWPGVYRIPLCLYGDTVHTGPGIPLASLIANGTASLLNT